MTDSAEKSSGRKPELIAYNVTYTGDGKSYSNKVGAAWEHRDAQGYELELESIPVSGRVSLRKVRDERLDEMAEQRKEEPQEEQRARRRRSHEPRT